MIFSYLLGLMALVNSADKICVVTYVYSLGLYSFSFDVKLLFCCVMYSRDIDRKAPHNF